jgi:signal transduction histidine kinase
MKIADILFINRKSLQPPENRYIVFLISIVFVVGYIFDIIFGNLSNVIIIIDCGNIITSIIVLSLFFIKKIDVRFALKIQVRALLLNIVLSHFINPLDDPNYTGIFLRNVILIGFIVPIYGIYCGKYHIIQIGFAFLLIYFSTIIRTDNQFLLNSAPLLIVCGTMYLVGVFHIIGNLEKMQNKQNHLRIELQEQADLLREKNDFLEKQQKQILEQSIGLKQLNQDKDLFLSILAHDLKSPFSGILGLTQLLAKNIRKYDIDKTEDLLMNVNKAANNSYKLLDDLLMWAHSQMGKLPFDPKSFMLAEICLETEEMLKLNAVEKNITINICKEKDISVFADREMLKTVLRNLVSNAIKFTNTDGTISVNAVQNQKDVTISVSDNGVGIEPELLENLFNISHRNSTLGTANEKGTGFGLLICKDFINKHGGEIWVESEVGKGSVFKFMLPFLTD